MTKNTSTYLYSPQMPEYNPTTKTEETTAEISHLTQGNIGLLIVDLQEGFNPSPDLVEKIKKLTEQDYAAVFATKFVNMTDSQYRSQLDYTNMSAEDPAIDLVFREPRSKTLIKPGYGLSPEQIDLLKSTGINTWHLCGLQTDACVMACAFNLWDSGLIPVLISDCCEASSEKAHEEAVASFTRQFGINNVRWSN